MFTSCIDTKLASTQEEDVYSVGSPTHLLKYAWYHGKLSSEEANQLLTSMEGSCFLVREDKDSFGSILLSVKSDEGVSHFIINRGPGWYRVDGTSKQFEVVADLLAHYRNYSLTKAVLGSPCLRASNQSISTGMLHTYFQFLPCLLLGNCSLILCSWNSCRFQQLQGKL